MSTQGKRRRKGAPVSEKEERWIQILYNRGLTQEKIAEKTGVSQQHISRMKMDGAWNEDSTPYHTPQDVLSLLDEHTFLLLLELRSGKIEDESRAILDLKNLAATKKDVQEYIITVNRQALILSLQSHMQWLATYHPEAREALEHAQKHHEEEVKLL